MAQAEIIKPNLKTKKVNVSLNKKLRVGAYARVSTDSEEQLNSYESQIRFYTEKIKANPEWEFVGIYADEGISGTRVKNRTEFLRMIDDAMNGKIDMIIAKSISRFARNTLDTLKYVRDLRDKKIDVYFEKENIHTLQLDSEMFLTLYSAFAQAESESTSQNVKMGIRAKMKNGEPVGTVNPYGYDWDKETKKLVINEEKAKVVRQIFTWYCDGIGTSIIANKLNEMGIKSPGGKKWAQQYVRTMISQEKYVGDLIGQKNYVVSPLTHKKVRNYGEKEQYYVKNHHEAIISRDVWNKAQEILNKRRSKIIPDGAKHFSKFTQRYTFSSKIVCGFCGTNYARRISGKRKNGNQIVYWSCYNKVLNANNCSDAILIREELLKSAFVEIHNSIVKNKYKTKDLMLKVIKESINTNDYKKKLDTLNNEKNTLEKRLSNLIDMKLDDYDHKEAYITKEKEINERLDLIKKEIANYEMLENENKDLSRRIKIVENLFEEPTTLKEFDDETFNSMVEKIIVGGYDEDENKNSKMIRFVLKTGEEKPFILAEKKETKKMCHLNWARGVGCPDISYLEDLSKLLNISVVELLRGEENAEVNEQSIIESIKTSNEITKVQIRKTISTILMTIIILISSLIIISNIKIIRSITRKYYYDFSYLESKKEELNNYYKIIINNQGIYSDDDYDKIKEFVNNTKKKIDSFNYKNGYYTLSEFYKIYDNYMNIFMESNLKIDAPYDILLKYDLDIYQHLHTYYVANNILNNHFSKFEEYLIGLYRYSYRNFSEVFSHPNANYMLAKELMIFEDIIEVGELDD